MSYGIKLLLVDDNKDTRNYFEPLADLADNLLKAHLVQAYTWEEALRILEEDPYEYQGLILDGKGQKKVTSKTEDDAFLHIALTWLHSKRREGYSVPYVIYSGYADSLRLIFDEESIFWKSKGEERLMYMDIQKQIADSDSFHLRALFPDVFELFKLSLLHSKYLPDIIKVLQVLNGSFTGNYADIIRAIRPMIEASFIQLQGLDRNLISQKYFDKGNPDISGIIYYLSGSPVRNNDRNVAEYYSERIFPDHIGYIATSLQKITSKTCMHHYESGVSKYLLNYCVNGFIEYILWFKSFSKKEYLTHVL